MKKYRFIIPIALVVLMVISWYTLIKDVFRVEQEYNQYLSMARRYARDGITKYAIENYNEALEIKSSPEIYVEVSDYYRKQNDAEENLSWCKNFFELYPKDYRAYDCLLRIYMDDKDYESCYDILETAEKKKINSDYIRQVSNSIMYEYEIDFNSYSDVGIYSANYCPVKSKKSWGFVDRYGNSHIPGKYPEVGYFTQSGFAAVKDNDGSVYFIDKSGDKVISLSGKYEMFGLLVDGVFPAKISENRYIYMKENNSDKYFEDDSSKNDLYIKSSDEYEYASTFNVGLAAVKTNGKWQIIDMNYRNIGDNYVDIKLDDKEIAVRNDRYFAAVSEGKYFMFDSKGKQVCNTEFEDARVFSGDMPTAVKVDGSWRFIDKNGKFTSDNVYDEARPYSNGLAAVCVNGKWGFVDENEKIVIEAQFVDCRDFNEKGSCFVKTGDKWQLLKLYRLNRED